MAAKNSTENHVADSEAPASDATVPHQVTPESENVVNLVEHMNESLGDKAKRVLRANSKPFLAGAASVVLIAAGVFVVKKRAETPDEDSE